MDKTSFLILMTILDILKIQTKWNQNFSDFIITFWMVWTPDQQRRSNSVFWFSKISVLQHYQPGLQQLPKPTTTTTFLSSHIGLITHLQCAQKRLEDLLQVVDQTELNFPKRSYHLVLNYVHESSRAFWAISMAFTLCKRDGNSNNSPKHRNKC